MTELRESLLWMFRQMVDKAVIRYLNDNKDSPQYKTIEVVINGFTKYLYDNTSQHRLERNP